MDYEDFKKEFKKYNAFEEWNSKEDSGLDLPQINNKRDGNYWLKIVEGYDTGKVTPIEDAVERVRSIREDIDRVVHENYVGPVDNDGNFYDPEARDDMVNSPAHYTRGSQEAIEIIEEAIQDAPDVKSGMLQAQALKYLLRVWLKGNAKQDLQKCVWYLQRLIDSL